MVGLSEGKISPLKPRVPAQASESHGGSQLESLYFSLDLYIKIWLSCFVVLFGLDEE
jgi:hypothetical protein